MSGKVKPKAVSGFPEWSPSVRAAELKWIETIRDTFEQYGFCSIETPSAEAVDILMSKGEDTDKEIYALTRLQDAGQGKMPKMALRYDLTVPLARYVAQHFNDLTFPFKRYQIQRTWRGERPQEGRFREFTQCDIDVIDQGKVSMEFDAELARIVYKIFNKLGVDRVTFNINNRKILQGFYEGLAVEDSIEAIRIVDKIDKIGAEGVSDMLKERLGLSQGVIEKCLALASIKTSGTDFKERVLSLGVSSPLLEEGLEELGVVMDALSDVPEGVIYANLSIARGFDYYTGTVYEGKLVDYPDFPTIFAGGRYENLVGSYLNRSLPGVGISIGLTRIFSKLLSEGLIQEGPQCPTQVLITTFEDSNFAFIRTTAEEMRERGIKVEVYHNPIDIGKQMKYANKKGIPYVLFPSKNENEAHQIKNMNTGKQYSVNTRLWEPK